MSSQIAVVFDAGNTILHLDYEFMCQVLAEHGAQVEPIQLRIAEYSARAAIDRELAPDMVPPESVEGLLWGDGERPAYFAVALQRLGIRGAAAEPMLAALRRHNQERCLWRVILPDTTTVFGTLRDRGFRLAVVSNADGRVEADLRAAGLGEFFETIIDSSVVGVEKPDPRIFHIALDKLGVAPAQAYYVGDVYGIDVVGSRRAGMSPILMDRLERYPRELDCPRIRILSELVGLLPS